MLTHALIFPRVAGTLLSLSLSLAALVALPAHALTSASGPSAEPLWEVGVVALGLTQQAWPGASESVRRTIALPYVLYRGPVLRIDRGAVGLRAVKQSDFELDIGFAGALGSNAGEAAARQGMPALGTLVEFGPRARLKLGNDPGGGQWGLELPVRGVFDATDRLATRGFAFEPRVQWSPPALAGWRVGASVGALLGDRQLAGTFYDVAPAYATGLRPAYDAKAGLIAWRMSLTASHRLTRDWRVFGFGRLDSVAGAANAVSPLVSRTTGYSAGVGLQWTWLRSDRSASD